MKKLIACTAGLFLTASLFAGGLKETAVEMGGKTELSIAAAISLSGALDEIIKIYSTVNQGVAITANYGSSGSLQQQIEQGAPIDIFFSAARRQMDSLRQKGLILEDTHRNLLENKLVLVVPRGNKNISSFTDAGTSKVTQIALGEPESVPAGQYAAQVFRTLGILDAVVKKTVYAKNVRQVLTYVSTGEVDAGVVYATDAAGDNSVTVVAEAPAGSNEPIVYPAALIKATVYPEAAGTFLDWLSGDEASNIIISFGFSVH